MLLDDAAAAAAAAAADATAAAAAVRCKSSWARWCVETVYGVKLGLMAGRPRRRPS